MDLEEVKEYFKDAKQVKCLVDNKIYNIDVKGSFKSYPNTEKVQQINFEFIDHQRGQSCVVLYVTDELSEIISYKEEDLPEEDLPEDIFEERVMLVSDDEENCWPRVVFMEKNNRFIAWNYAKTIEEAGEVCKTTDWKFAKELPKELPKEFPKEFSKNSQKIPKKMQEFQKIIHLAETI